MRQLQLTEVTNSFCHRRQWIMSKQRVHTNLLTGTSSTKTSSNPLPEYSKEDLNEAGGEIFDVFIQFEDESLLSFICERRFSIAMANSCAIFVDFIHRMKLLNHQNLNSNSLLINRAFFKIESTLTFPVDVMEFFCQLTIETVLSVDSCHFSVCLSFDCFLRDFPFGLFLLVFALYSSPLVWEFQRIFGISGIFYFEWLLFVNALMCFGRTFVFCFPFFFAFHCFVFSSFSFSLF